MLICVEGGARSEDVVLGEKVTFFEIVCVADVGCFLDAVSGRVGFLFNA